MALNQKIMFVLLIFTFMLFTSLYSAVARAGIFSPVCLTHQSPDYIHQFKIYRPSPPRPFWTGWRYQGNCRKNCKVDRWSGHIYCCKQICR